MTKLSLLLQDSTVQQIGVSDLWGQISDNEPTQLLNVTLKYKNIRAIYTVLRICSTPTFPIFNLSRFERELLKLHQQMISHFVALDHSVEIFQIRCCFGILKIFDKHNIRICKLIFYQPK